MSLFDFDDMKPVIISAVIILNVAFNSLVIAVIVRYPQLREDRTTLFMLSLSLSDLANGCTAMPISAAVCSKATPNVRNLLQYLPHIQAMCSSWFVVNSMHSLCWVTVCKMVAITKPLHYEQTLTQARCYIIIAGIWLFGAFVAVVVTIRTASWELHSCIHDVVSSQELPTYVTVLMMCCFIGGLVLPLTVTTYATSRIFCVIVRTHRQIAAQTNSIRGHIDVVGNIPSLTSRSIRSGRNVLIICLADLILTIPAVIRNITIIIWKENDLPDSFKFFAIWALYSNTFVNSLLYLILFRQVRSKVMDMLKACYQYCDFR